MAREVFTLEIELGNDAMQDGADVAGALEQVASLVGGWGRLYPSAGERLIRDASGNTVGRFLTEERPL